LLPNRKQLPDEACKVLTRSLCSKLGFIESRNLLEADWKLNPRFSWKLFIAQASTGKQALRGINNPDLHGNEARRLIHNHLVRASSESTHRAGNYPNDESRGAKKIQLASSPLTALRSLEADDTLGIIILMGFYINLVHDSISDLISVMQREREESRKNVMKRR
jgi:hypothetical protein